MWKLLYAVNDDEHEKPISKINQHTQKKFYNNQFNEKYINNFLI